ncbi:hypothetical protein [Tepidibacter hydrothermalis]|uniref:Knr4/Smi1-like domain-containing protein n=1 Tax=Tepidibacter hydrothermalis TaxID=3036126 RepID=A0ABY8EG63_9FIRM|nr:hypothetical protein [Tepidibacter hydrothermalis]WFD11945.1 hypothetical protein P4S50_07675 [Tepidibacter hydrothermalis]
MEHEKLNEKHKKEILNKLKLAEAKRGKKINLNPPIEASEVRMLEEKYNFKLPPDYFWFITEIGDGGEGPHGDLMKFGGREEIYYELCGKENRLPKLESMKDVNRYQCEFINESQNNKYAFQEGLLSLCYKRFKYPDGSVYSYDDEIALIVNGNNYGELVNIHVSQERIPRDENTNHFLEWYERYIGDVILDCNISYNFENLLGGSVAELADLYKKTKDNNKKGTIWNSFIKFKKLSEEEKGKLYELFIYETNDDLKIQGLHILQKIHYEKIDEVFISLMTLDNKGIFSELSRIISYKYTTSMDYKTYRCYGKDGIENWYEHALRMFPYILEQVQDFYGGFVGSHIHIDYCLKLITVNPKFKVDDLEPYFMNKNNYIVTKIIEECMKYGEVNELNEFFKRQAKRLMEMDDCTKLDRLLNEMRMFIHQHTEFKKEIEPIILEGSKFIVSKVDSGIEVTVSNLENIRNRLKQ